jgi:uncharacterized protein (DUF1330 family)
LRKRGAAITIRPRIRFFRRDAREGSGMTAVMVVLMNIHDEGWIADYFAAVPGLIAEYGGGPVAASRSIRVIEGDVAPPDRIAVFAFPSMKALDDFMADERYQRFKASRLAGSQSEIFVFENLIGASAAFA